MTYVWRGVAATGLSCVLVASVVLGSATPAGAHVGGGVGPTNYRSEVLTIRPSHPGVTFRAVELGSRLEVRNTSEVEVMVLGYEEEPYLRVGPSGVFENTRSPATYINATREGRTTVPDSADATARPEWRKVSSRSVARWHDHRAHWMGNERPPGVKADPQRRQVVLPEWRVPITVGEEPVAVVGRLIWVPGPKPWIWLAAASGIAATVVVLSRRRRWPPIVAGVLTLTIAADLLAAVGTALGLRTVGASGAIDPVGLLVLPLIFGTVGVGGIRRLVRNDLEGCVVAVFCGAAVAIIGGLADLGTLSSSQVPFAGGPLAGRVVVTACLGLGSGLVVAGLWRLNAGGRLFRLGLPSVFSRART